MSESPHCSELLARTSAGLGNIRGNAELCLLLDSMRSVVLYVDRWCVIQHANERACNWRTKERLSGKSIIEITKSWENPFEIRREIMQVIRTGKSIWQSVERSVENGHEYYYQVDKIPIKNDEGEVNGALIIIDDISDTVRQEKAIFESEARYRAFVANSTDAIWRYDLYPPIDIDVSIDEQVQQIYRRAELVECNERLVSLHGEHSMDNIIGSRLCSNFSTLPTTSVRDFVLGDYRLECREFEITNKHGEHLSLEISAVGEIKNGKLLRFWGTSRDVTPQKRHLDRLEYLANYDPLTGLPNRVLLYRQMEKALAERQDRQKFGLLLIDLDRFKEINDTLGHQVGDQVLKQLGPRFESELDRISGVVARLGGDEFAIFLKNIRNAQQAVVMGHRFLDAVCDTFELDSFRTEISASIGVAIAPDQAEDVTTLMRYADIAMYHAKVCLKGVAIYDTSIDSHTPVRLELMGALGRAIRENQLRLHFQPKVRVSDQKVYGFESLVRWEHPELGLVPPNEFIPIAEKSSVIHPMTVWVLEETAKQCAQWNQQGYDIIIAMNLSSRNLLDERIIIELERVLNKYQLSGEHLEMEITESMLMSDPKRAERILERISAFGVRLSVDDFGTGYSSLAYLKRLPVQSLKIDCGFVKGMLEDEQDEIIVHSTIQLAHNLGLSVVAEGVEDLATYGRLNELGCDSAQGYYIARPMDQNSADDWLANGARFGSNIIE